MSKLDKKAFAVRTSVSDAGPGVGVYLSIEPEEKLVHRTITVSDQIKGLGAIVNLDVDEDGKLMGVEIV